MLGTQQASTPSPGVYFPVAPQDAPPEYDAKSPKYRDRLRGIMTDDARTTVEKVRDILHVGTEWLDVQHGCLVRIDRDADAYTIVAANSASSLFSPGDTADLSNTYCRKVLEADKALAVGNAPQQGWIDDPAYQEFQLATYLGAKVVVNSRLYGTVCFTDPQPRGPSFDERDALIVELVVRTIGQVLESDRRSELHTSTNTWIEALFEEAPDMVSVLTPDGTLVAANAHLRAKTGYEEADLVGMKVWTLDQDADPVDTPTVLSEMAPGERRRRTGTYERQDGSRFPVKTHLRRIRPPHDDRILAISRDITPRTEPELDLLDQRKKVQALYRATRTLLTAEEEADVARSIRSLVNEVFGYPIVAVRFRKSNQLVPVDLSPEIPDYMPDRPPLAVDGKNVVAKAYHRGSTVVYDDLRTADDPHDYGAARATAVIPIGTYGTISVADMDIGTVDRFDCHLIEVLGTYAAAMLNRLDQEDDVRTMKNKAEAANRAKSAFLSNMSHEIRTPLTSIIGFAEVIGEEIDTLPQPVDNGDLDSLRRFSTLIARSGKRLMDTLTAVLNLSKLEAQDMDLTPEPVDFADEIRSAATLFAPQAADAGLHFRTEAEDAPVWGYVDRDGLRLVLHNLLSNAIKYTEEGEIWLRTRMEEEAAIVEVEDTGIGIEVNDLAQHFTAFRQGSEGKTRKYEGSGLGLAIIKKVVDQTNASIDVHAKTGAGTCVTVSFPVGDPQTPEPPVGS